jgi:hypothetical protein
MGTRGVINEPWPGRAGPPQRARCASEARCLFEEIELVVADMDRAASYARVTGTHDGDFMGLPATGRTVDFRVMGILRFANGQAMGRWRQPDLYATTRVARLTDRAP